MHRVFRNRSRDQVNALRSIYVEDQGITSLMYHPHSANLRLLIRRQRSRFETTAPCEPIKTTYPARDADVASGDVRPTRSSTAVRRGPGSPSQHVQSDAMQVPSQSVYALQVSPGTPRATVRWGNKESSVWQAPTQSPFAWMWGNRVSTSTRGRERGNMYNSYHD
ncbi:hypothetical protein B0H12DRAFT_1129167 [Mycena haematopus]|nr:hypothetical protein B0H12DRAFT_1129167 [Mycena haematopus]